MKDRKNLAEGNEECSVEDPGSIFSVRDSQAIQKTCKILRSVVRRRINYVSLWTTLRRKIEHDENLSALPTGERNGLSQKIIDLMARLEQTDSIGFHKYYRQLLETEDANLTKFFTCACIASWLNGMEFEFNNDGKQEIWKVDNCVFSNLNCTVPMVPAFRIFPFEPYKETGDTLIPLYIVLYGLKF